MKNRYISPISENFLMQIERKSLFHFSVQCWWRIPKVHYAFYVIFSDFSTSFSLRRCPVFASFQFYKYKKDFKCPCVELKVLLCYKTVVQMMSHKELFLVRFNWRFPWWCGFFELDNANFFYISHTFVYNHSWQWFEISSSLHLIF